MCSECGVCAVGAELGSECGEYYIMSVWSVESVWSECGVRVESVYMWSERGMCGVSVESV